MSKDSCSCRLRMLRPSTVFALLILYCWCHSTCLGHSRRANGVLRYVKRAQYQCYSLRETSADANHFRTSLLRPLLIERVSGTRGNVRAREHILSKLRSTEIWDIELDTFTAPTPDGEVEFSNIIATLNPSAPRHLVLACHYDSKKLPNFIGVIDSAVPCAMLLDLADRLQRQLAEQKHKKKQSSLQLIFFDGEEAVRDWSMTDSLYGSRHLATKMRNSNVIGQKNLNRIDAIDMFVLLDLIGSKDSHFSNLFDVATGTYYRRFQEIEKELLRVYAPEETTSAVFSSTTRNSIIEDDHTPFLGYDVPILHLIPTPFPPVWHRSTDNEENLDFASIKHLRNVMEIFVTSYLHLKQASCLLDEK